MSDRVLVVDDNAQNRQVAEAHLAAAGYEIVLAESGERALERFAADKPDLVLLDVMMPGLDGFETCRRLRELPGGADVAIVFLTSLSDLSSHQQAMSSGADDYLTKPINRTELLLRVRSLLRVKRLTDELRRERDALVVAQRQKQELTAMLVHDLKNPLSIIVANADYVAGHGAVPVEARDGASDIVDSAQSLLRMIMNLLDIGRSEDGALTPRWSEVDVDELVEEVRAEQRRRLDARRHKLTVRSAVRGAPIQADKDLLRRLVDNLVDNAVKYSPDGSTITIVAEPDGEGVVLRVCDEGPGIPEGARARVFEKYARLDGAEAAETRTSRGLGLAFCRLAAEAHGGRIWIEDHLPRGSAFCVQLPRRRS